MPDLLTDLSALLHDALDLMRELGRADDKSDQSYGYQPSISEHPQNQHFQDWTALIKLVREAWLATAAKFPERAALMAESWSHTPYPLFRRLAFFAAAHDSGVISPRRALDWLLAEEHRWLWADETKRESMRLLVALAPQLNAALRAELEQAMLAGPPRAIFGDDLEPEHWTGIVDEAIWLRLKKIDETKAALGKEARDRLDKLSARYPEWKLAEDQRDEFPLWMGEIDSSATPRRRRELIKWLKQHPSRDPWLKDDWQARCRDNFATTACALCALARKGTWPTDRWREALQAWSKKRSWRYMAPVFITAPEDMLQTLAHSVSSWLRIIAPTFEGHEKHFFELARRILALYDQDDQESVATGGNLVTWAINHPVGKITEALLRWCFRQSLEDGQGLPGELKPTFTELCDTRISELQHGRVVLAAHVTTLYRVDQKWTEKHLLPLFNWQSSESEAKTVWKGFLWSPRLYHPLMQKLKPAFLDTAHHYAALGKHGGQYASLLTFAALDPSDIFTNKELAAATRLLPSDGLKKVAQALVVALKSAGEQGSEYWANRVAPYLRTIWPKNRDSLSPTISETFARLCIAAYEAFPQALKQLQNWLQPIKNSNYIVHLLKESGLCKQFPAEALELLNAVIAEQSWEHPGEKLTQCLDEIAEAAPQLEQDDRYLRLRDFLRRWEA